VYRGYDPNCSVNIDKMRTVIYKHRNFHIRSQRLFSVILWVLWLYGRLQNHEVSGILIWSVTFIAYHSITGVSNRKPAFTTTFCDNCGAQVSDQIYAPYKGTFHHLEV
jgi:hypothetical protein